MSDLPEVTELKRYRHEPGDKILATVPRRLDMDVFVRLRQLISVALEVPEADVLIVSDGILIEVVTVATAASAAAPHPAPATQPAAPGSPPRPGP